jgi:hypothetical protein
VSAIDPKTDALERTVSVGGSTPFVTANTIAADADGAWVVSSAAGRGAVTLVQPGIKIPREFLFDYDPVGVAVGEGAVWVAAKKLGNNVVLRVNRRTGDVVEVVKLRSANVPSGSPRDIMAIAAGEGAVWALQGGVVHRLDPSTRRVSGRVKLPTSEATDVEAGDGAVWVTMFAPPRGNVLVRIDPRTLRVTKTTTAPIPYGSSLFSSLALDDGELWWNGADSGTIWRVDPRTGRVASGIRLTPPVEAFLAIQPVGIAAGAGGVWVTVSIQP